MKNDSVSSPARPPQSKYLARAPAFHPPPLSCDAHVHIFGPAARFPYVGDRRYTPQDTPKEDLAALHAALGIERSVLVQATCHGTDNRAMLDALNGVAAAIVASRCWTEASRTSSCSGSHAPAFAESGSIFSATLAARPITA